MPPHVKIKIVHGCKYWWNVKKKRWEGLINNVTPSYRINPKRTI